MTFITGSLTAFAEGLSAAADEEVSPVAEARGKAASCPASAQQAKKRNSCFARALKLPRVKGDSKTFMECELPMLVYPMPILPKTSQIRI
jgi:hypothetical protein